MTPKLSLLAGLVVASLAIGLVGASAGKTADPGITAKSITVGGTYPFSGPASLYAPIGVAESAYFKYVNDHGGVNGRKISYVTYDDGYNPAQTVQLTRKLVE